VESDQNTIYERHYEDSVLIPASATEIFAFIDDHTRFSSHMNKSSWMMGGGRMDTSVDAGRGQEIGSRIHMNGRAFGITLFLDEIVIRREPPHVKIWETVGPLKLLVIGNYRITVEIQSQRDESLLRVSIDYDLPTTNVWLGKLFGAYYARWCVKQMINDTLDHFRE